MNPQRIHGLKVPAAMEMLRPGEVKPRGWLRDWCVTARNGYISRMDEIDQAFPRAWNVDFQPRGKFLDWGDPDRGAWCAEGGAYWFEGLVRLAWELDDAELKDMARRRLEPLLERMYPKAIGFVHWLDRDNQAQMKEVADANHGFIVGASGRTTRAVMAYWEATGDERAIRALRWCLDDPRFYFLGNPVTLPAPAIDTWRYCGDERLAAAVDNFFATHHDPARWPAVATGYPWRRAGSACAFATTGIPTATGRGNCSTESFPMKVSCLSQRERHGLATQSGSPTPAPGSISSRRVPVSRTASQ